MTVKTQSTTSVRHVSTA